MERPAVLHVLERAIEVLDQDCEIRPIERDAAGEGLADNLVGNRHVGDQHGDALAFVGGAAHFQRVCSPVLFQQQVCLQPLV